MVEFGLGFLSGIVLMIGSTFVVLYFMERLPSTGEEVHKKTKDGGFFTNKKYKPDNLKAARTKQDQKTREIEEELRGIYDDGVS